MNPQKVFDVYTTMIETIPEDQDLTYEDIYLLAGAVASYMLAQIHADDALIKDFCDRIKFVHRVASTTPVSEVTH